MNLPRVLTGVDLPDAELASMRLDGEIYPLADGWCAVDELEGAKHRAAAVRGLRSTRLIAELGTAAWVWGAIAPLPPILEFCVGLDARARPSRTAAVHLRELVLEPGDVVDWGDGAVTTPLRTVVDLARFRVDWSAHDQSTVTCLTRIGGVTLGDCEQLLDRRRNLPGKLLARERLVRLLGAKLSPR